MGLMRRCLDYLNSLEEKEDVIKYNFDDVSIPYTVLDILDSDDDRPPYGTGLSLLVGDDP